MQQQIARLDSVLARDPQVVMGIADRQLRLQRLLPTQCQPCPLTALQHSGFNIDSNAQPTSV